MQYYILASGSKGNCAIIKTAKSCIMIDCGCTKKYLEEALTQINLKLSDIDAVVLTHEHSDHIRSINMFQKFPVYCPFELKEKRGEILVTPYQEFIIEDVNIFPIALSHDTEQTVGYIICDDKDKLVFVTDTGYISERNIDYMKDANYYVIESNHDISMLMATNRPHYLKARIMSAYGHLCNDDCGEILCQCVSEKTEEIVLAHISQEANTKELAYNTVVEQLSQINYPVSKKTIKAMSQFEIFLGGKE